LRKLASERPLSVFFVLACLLSWWPAALYAADLSPTPALTPLGPLIAAVAVLGATEGRSGVGGLLRSMVTWRVPRRAYLAAVGIPVVISAAAIGINLALGAARPEADDLAAWTQIPLAFAVILLVPGLGGTMEEPGFRGFALGRLERRFGVVAGPLLLGALWVVWHGPLFLVGDIAWPDLLVIPSASVVIASVFHLGRDSVLIAMVLHAMNNAVGGGYTSQLFHGSEAVRVNLLVAAGWILLAVACSYAAARGVRPAAPG
jgi:membrane protease YdiL (CAAX protease family)